MHLLDYSLLSNILLRNEMHSLASELESLLVSGFDVSRYGDIPRWREVLEMLPAASGVSMVADSSVVTLRAEQQPDTAELKNILMGLHPWRKGPFDIFGVYIDTEWRSDWKWNRLSGAIDTLSGRRVLDVGCGSGYHCWRMRGEHAALVVGVDPTPLFVLQYWAVQRYAQDPGVWVLPARLEQLPSNMAAFDTVFSMGVLYHRRSPFEHLLELKSAMAVDAQLVLETLVIEGDENDVLVPQGRYSKMGNVWFIPSVKALVNWLRKLNFRDIRVVDVSVTTTDEQRATEWMRFHSLTDFLSPENSDKTIEGYPAPRRAILTARL